MFRKSNSFGFFGLCYLDISRPRLPLVTMEVTARIRPLDPHGHRSRGSFQSSWLEVFSPPHKAPDAYTIIWIHTSYHINSDFISVFFQCNCIFKCMYAQAFCLCKHGFYIIRALQNGSMMCINAMRPSHHQLLPTWGFKEPWAVLTLLINRFGFVTTS